MYDVYQMGTFFCNLKTVQPEQLLKKLIRHEAKGFVQNVFQRVENMGSNQHFFSMFDWKKKKWNEGENWETKVGPVMHGSIWLHAFETSLWILFKSLYD